MTRRKSEHAEPLDFAGLISWLADAGVQAAVEGDDLVLSQLPPEMPERVRAAVRAHKKQLVQAIRTVTAAEEQAQPSGLVNVTAYASRDVTIEDVRDADGRVVPGLRNVWKRQSR